MDREDIFHWTAILLFGLLLIGLVIVAIMTGGSSEYDECKEQCTLKNFTYESFTGGGYTNKMCNCRNLNKEIITIYSK